MSLRIFTPIPSVAAASFNNNSVLLTASSSQYISFGNNVSDDYNTASSWTAWVKFNTLTSAQKSILAKITGGPSYTGYLLYLDNANKLGWFECNTYSTNLLSIITSSSAVATGSWYHLAITRDGTGTAAGTTIYVNGVAQTVTVSNNTLSATTVNTQALLMGADDEGVFEDYVDGYMALVSHWNAALTSGNISTLYNGGTPVNPLTQSFSANCDHHWPLGNSPDTISAGGIGDRVGTVNGTPVNSPTISNVHP